MKYFLILGIENSVKYQCLVCFKSYRYDYNLRRHQKYECKNLKSYSFGCPYCNYKCNRADNIYKHQRTKHPNEEVYCINYGP